MNTPKLERGHVVREVAVPMIVVCSSALVTGAATMWAGEVGFLGAVLLVGLGTSAADLLLTAVGPPSVKPPEARPRPPR